MEANTDATLQVIQPADGPACPGDKVILTCTAPPVGDVTANLRWQLSDSQITYLGIPITGTLGNFTITFFVSQDNHVISNATLSKVLFTYNNITIGCRNVAFQLLPETETVMVAGM